MKTKEMYDAQFSYSHGDEIKGLNNNLGNVQIECNGHRSMVEPKEFMNNF